ncbi:MAG TPA: hypothetical protein VFC46_03710, partial [Humisphaera sp.]|nr:hypothetical protein [Humisphaera sp.]
MAILLIALSVAPARGEVTPMDAVLKEDAITRITCRYGGEQVTPEPGITFSPAAGEYHYDLYLPAGYNADPKAVFACLFVASPGGNAGLGAMAERVKRDRFIAVMLVESKNGAWEPGIANFCSAHDDVIKRLRVAEGFKYMTGMSGGARSTSMYTALRPGFVGMFLQAAGFWQTPDGPYAMNGVRENSRMAVYATFGTKDMNLDEAGLLAQYLPAKTAYHPRIFRGGHQWAPKPQVEEAFDWLE